MIDSPVKSLEASTNAVGDDEFFEPHHDAYTTRWFTLNPHDRVQLAE
jgi:hypothetical protein